jgi:hypothetical protein
VNQILSSDLHPSYNATPVQPQPAIILDYASPRKRVRLRMPAKSHIDLAREPGKVMVIEYLRGKADAIGGIVFAGLMLAYLGLFCLTVRNATWVLGPFWLAEAGVLLLVIHQTWRRTLLTVTAESIDLTFTSPFTTKRYQWPTIDLAVVRAMVTANPNSARPLGELRIELASGGEVHLFSDHKLSQIDEIVAAIRAITDPVTAMEPPPR